MKSKPRIAIVTATVAALLGASLVGVAHSDDAQPPGFGAVFSSRVALSANSTVYFSGNDLDNLKSLTYTCTNSRTLTLNRVTPVPGANGALASVVVPASLLKKKKLSKGDTCKLTSATPIQGVAFSWSGASLRLYVHNNPLAITSPSPSALEASFPTASPPTVLINSTAGALAGVTAVTQVMCSSNWPGVFPRKVTTQSANQVAFTPQSLPAQSCGVLLTYQDRSSILVSGPGSTGTVLNALTYTPWVTGPIRIQVTNTSDVVDDSLYVGVVADTSGGGSAAPFTGVNLATVTSLAFTDLTGYQAGPDDSGGTAYFEIQQPIISGVIYLSDTDLNGQAAPNPQTSTVRYSMAEFTYGGGFFTDLTLIDQIGFSMSSRLFTDQAGTLAVSKSRRTTGCLADLVAGLQKIVPPAAWTAANGTGTAGVIRYDAAGTRVVGYIGAAKIPAAYMTEQVKTYAQYVQTLSPLTIRDVHNAANQPGPFNYTATYAPGTDMWTLKGTITDGGETVTGPTLTVEGSSIYGPGTKPGTGYAMYGEDGPFKVVLGGTNYGWSNGSALAGTGYQDLVKTIYRDFIVGFAYGYWGGKYGGGTNTGANAQNFTRNPLTAAYGNAGVPSQYAAWNSYDELIRTVSKGGGGAAGAYGTAYSDTFLPPGLSPAIGTYQAQNWTITLGDAPGCAPTPGPGPTPTPTPTPTPAR